VPSPVRSLLAWQLLALVAFALAIVSRWISRRLSS
jgi:hypothetical protein